MRELDLLNLGSIAIMATIIHTSRNMLAEAGDRLDWTVYFIPHLSAQLSLLCSILALTAGIGEEFGAVVGMLFLIVALLIVTVGPRVVYKTIKSFTTPRPRVLRYHNVGSYNPKAVRQARAAMGRP